MAASEAEGFGLPLIEASRYNLPVIARDIPVLREVAGAHAFYFDGSTAEALAAAVTTWMERDAAGKAPRSDNMLCLTWEQSTRRLMKAILPSFKGDVLSDG
jgi:glycosyltransferase involved in cell wall biosynthesis